VTTTQVELAVLTLVMVGVIVAVIVTYRGIVRLVVERQKAMDTYVKAVTREKLTAVREAQNALQESQQVREEARATLRSVEQHFNDPRVKRFLGD
jgi:type VI protein secretion system component VasK